MPRSQPEKRMSRLPFLPALCLFALCLSASSTALVQSIPLPAQPRPGVFAIQPAPGAPSSAPTTDPVPTTNFATAWSTPKLDCGGTCDPAPASPFDWSKFRLGG